MIILTFLIMIHTHLSFLPPIIYSSNSIAAQSLRLVKRPTNSPIITITSIPAPIPIAIHHLLLANLSHCPVDR